MRVKQTANSSTKTVIAQSAVSKKLSPGTLAHFPPTVLLPAAQFMGGMGVWQPAKVCQKSEISGKK